MAIDMSSLRRVKADKPPILLIYGPEKMGKTTLAAEFPAPVFIQTEDGASGTLELDSFGLLGSFGEVLDGLGTLASEDHAFKTVVIDSVSKLEKLVFAEVCERNNWKSIEQPGYGKGYVEADYVWNELVEACRYLRDQRQMTVVLIGHSVTDRFDDPETQSYSRYTIDLHKRAMAILTREVDAILLIKRDVTIKTEGAKGAGRARADGGDTRWIYCEGRPAFQAGNRFNMPERIMFKRGEGYTQLAAYLPSTGAASSAEPSKKAA
jgi:hypothetical protein